MREKTLRFINSNWFIFFLMSLAVINWSLETIYIYIPIAVLLTYVIILLDFNRTRLIPILMAGLICFQLKQIESHIVTFGIMLVFLIPILLYDIFKNRKFQFNFVFFGLLMWTLASVSSSFRTTSFIHSFAGILQMLLLLSIFFYFYSALDINKTKYKETLIINFIFLGFAIIAETFIYLFVMGNFNDYINNDFNLGWGGFSSISTIFLVILFAIIGEYSKKSSNIFLPILINVFILFLMFFMTRGVYIAFLVIIIPFILHISKDFSNKNKLIRFTTITLMTVLCIILLIGIPFGIAGSVIERLSDSTVNFANLDIAFYRGMDVFMLNPIYGTGMFTSHYFLDSITSSLGNSFFYSNSIIQILSSLGLVGFGCFVYFLFTVFKKAKYNTIYNKIVMYIVISLSIIGFFDAVFLNVVIMVPLILFLVGIDEVEEKDKVREGENYV
ncbi:MAG: O-antigen ligase [Bacilli bacterium]|nr:O-antigen ligase [Bacilli bacterium]